MCVRIQTNELDFIKHSYIKNVLKGEALLVEHTLWDEARYKLIYKGGTPLIYGHTEGMKWVPGTRYILDKPLEDYVEYRVGPNVITKEMFTRRVNKELKIGLFSNLFFSKKYLEYLEYEKLQKYSIESANGFYAYNNLPSLFNGNSYLLEFKENETKINLGKDYQIIKVVAPKGTKYIRETSRGVTQVVYEELIYPFPKEVQEERKKKGLEPLFDNTIITN